MNPYAELSHEELEAQLIEIACERDDIKRKLGELSTEAQVNHDHWVMANEAMGVFAIRGTVQIEQLLDVTVGVL